jgi:hypothetical protein
MQMHMDQWVTERLTFRLDAYVVFYGALEGLRLTGDKILSRFCVAASASSIKRNYVVLAGGASFALAETLFFIYLASHGLVIAVLASALFIRGYGSERHRRSFHLGHLDPMRSDLWLRLRSDAVGCSYFYLMGLIML